MMLVVLWTAGCGLSGKAGENERGAQTVLSDEEDGQGTERDAGQNTCAPERNADTPGQNADAPEQNAGAVQGGEPETEASAAEEKGGIPSVTVMIYMDASTLESGDETFASYDIAQMTAAELSGQVTVLLETGGTAYWGYEGISAETTQRHQVKDGTLALLEDTGGQQDMTAPETLTEFLQYCAGTAPADRYLLILWGHGRGPETGYGMDDFQNPGNAMSLEEIASAVREAGIPIELIGFDACVMGNLETVYALRGCCDYLAVSEDYEPAYGWEYTEFLNALSEDPSIEIRELAKVIVEGFISEAERSGDRGIMAVIDMSYAKELAAAWESFRAGKNGTLDGIIERIWTDPCLISPVPASQDGYISDDALYSLQDFGLTDILAICELDASAEAQRMQDLLEAAVIYVDSFHMERTMCGLAVCP